MFQSTHPRRVWLAALWCSDGCCNSFNPHTHEGCDWILHYRLEKEEFQSTHPRRVWLGSSVSVCRCGLFQSTHPRRVWLWGGFGGGKPPRFQSTHPRRVWQPTLNAIVYECKVSIHTPTKGVTNGNWRTIADSRVSIHTPTKGVTRQWQAAFLLDFVSIHTPTKGVTDGRFRHSRILQVSIHTPTKGVTHKICNDHYRNEFQSTHPRRVWP